MPLGTFLDGRTPEQLRGLRWLSLSEVGHIVTAVSASDSGGGATQTWTAGTVDVPCRIDPLGTRREGRMTGGRIDERSTHVVTLPPGTDLDPEERFLIEGRGTFEVTAIRDRTREWTRVVEVIAA